MLPSGGSDRTTAGHQHAQVREDPHDTHDAEHRASRSRVELSGRLG